MSQFFRILVLAVFLPWTASAEVVRFEIEAVEPFAGGKEFGEVGAYERVLGKVHYAIDPGLRQNQAIVDVDLAERNAEGLVEFSADLFLLVPVDRAKANGAMLHGVNNRGNKLLLSWFNGKGGNNPSSEADAGNGFLFREGFTLVCNGWDGEVLPGNDRLLLEAPVATRGGEAITGPVRCEIVPSKAVERIDVNWANHGSYMPVKSELANATLTVRERPGDSRVVIPREKWKVHVGEISPEAPRKLPRVELEYPEGLKPALIYELIYEGRDPMVHGVCFAALRDLISAFKYGGGEGNPLLVDGKPFLTRAHSFGVSQSGRYLREYLDSGFNEDEKGRQVLDGAIPHVSGSGLGSFNHRFAQPTRHVSQHDHHDYPADRFPFTYGVETDPYIKREAGILEKALENGTAPFVLHTQSESEYWTRSGSLAHTDPLGTRDSVIPGKVRLYTFGGTQHGPSGYPPKAGTGKYPATPGDYKPFLRALLLAMDRWVVDGTPVPASVYPSFAKGTLVDWSQEETGFPEIPGVEYPKVIQQPSYFDYGPRWESERIADKQPPGVLGDYKVRAARCDADGNVVGCLSPPEVAVPIATYTGWNLMRADAGPENELVSLRGSYLVFPVTKKEREESGDPRASLEERYGSLENYLGKLKAKCEELRAGGYLLEEDVERIMETQEKRVSEIFAKIES